MQLSSLPIYFIIYMLCIIFILLTVRIISILIQKRKCYNKYIKKCSVSLFVNYIGNDTYVMHINMSNIISFEPDIILWVKYNPNKNGCIKFIKAKAQRIKNKNKIYDIVKLIKNIYYNHRDTINEHFNAMYKNNYTAMVLTYIQNSILEETYFKTELDPLGPIVVVRTEGKEYEL